MTDFTIEDFLGHMYGEAEGRVSVWWRSSPGSKSPYDKQAWFDWNTQQGEMLEFIESISDKDVCVTTAVYERDPKSGLDRRIPEFARKTSMVWMDSDTCNGDNYRIEPSWTVATSQGRWQHFWILDEAADILRVSELVHRISIAHDKNGADQSSWPANKIMRVPDTMNTSHGFPTRVKAKCNGLVYTLEEIEKHYADVVIPERALVREIPELSVDELPAYGNVMAKLPTELMDLAVSEPKEGQDRSRLRYKLLLELFRAGLSYEEVLSVAWHAPASKKWSEEDPRGLAGLSVEAVKAAQEAGTPKSEPVDPFGAYDDGEDELAIDKPVSILTQSERDIIEQHPSFIDRYLDFATSRQTHHNRAYDRILAWEILSLAYMDSCYLSSPNQARKQRCNVFGMILGETTSGKTTSFWLAKSVLREYFHQDPEFNLGGNASETALVKALHARDKKVSFFNSDEASGVLKVWVGQDWTSGMRERITELYDGEVNPLLRSSKNESVLTTSEAYFNVFLAGTQRGIMEYMTSELFHSGFIPRFIFGIGQPTQVNYDSYAIRQNTPDEKNKKNAGFDPAARQMAAVLRQNRAAMREFNDGDTEMFLDEESAKRLQDAAYGLSKEFQGHPMWDMIKPSIFRWQVNVHKAATLLAFDARRSEVNIVDMLHALNAGEEWFTNLLRILSQLNANSFERACSDIHAFVNSRNGRVGKTSLYKRFRQYTDWEMTNYLKSLQNQRRVWLNPQREGGREYFYSDAYEEK